MKGDAEAVARALERLLADRNMAPAELSRRSGVASSKVWELRHSSHGGTGLRVLVALSAILGCRPEYLADVYARKAAWDDREDEGNPPGRKERRQLADAITAISTRIDRQNEIFDEWRRVLR